MFMLCMSMLKKLDFGLFRVPHEAEIGLLLVRGEGGKMTAYVC